MTLVYYVNVIVVNVIWRVKAKWNIINCELL